MKDFYIDSVQAKKENHEDLYIETLVEVLGKEISWRDFKQLETDKQISVMLKLEQKIKLKKSNFDISKLSYAIQLSRSGIGLAALTDYTCNFCGKIEIWANSAVPNICEDCATDMAKKIAMYHQDIFKNK